MLIKNIRENTITLYSITLLKVRNNIAKIYRGSKIEICAIQNL